MLTLYRLCADKKEDVVYGLIGLCVHSGGAQKGHYYALSKRGSKVLIFPN